MTAQNQNEKLIDSLAADLKPVRVRHPFAKISLWLGAGLLCIAVAVFLDDLRGDYSTRITNPLYLSEILLSAALFLSAGWSLAWLSIPDRGGRKYSLWLPLFILLALAILSVFTLDGGLSFSAEGFHYHHCVGVTLTMLVGPLVFMALFARLKSYTTKPYMSAVMLALATGALGWAAMRLTCPVDHVQHVFLYHFLPLLIPGLLIAGLARRLFHW